MDKISVVALDLDGTVTEGREKIEEQNKQFLSALAKNIACSLWEQETASA